MTTPAALDDSELDKIYSFAVQLAKQAGQMLLDAVDARSGQTGGASHVEKESAVDLVTQTDEGESSRRLTGQASGCNFVAASYLYYSFPKAAQLGEDRTCNVTTRPYTTLFAGPSCMNFLHFLLTRWLHERRRGLYSQKCGSKISFSCVCSAQSSPLGRLSQSLELV